MLWSILSLCLLTSALLNGKKGFEINCSIYEVITPNNLLIPQPRVPARIRFGSHPMFLAFKGRTYHVTGRAWIDRSIGRTKPSENVGQDRLANKTCGRGEGGNRQPKPKRMHTREDMYFIARIWIESYPSSISMLTKVR